ncbi:NAD(P)H-hydrate dehydratase [Mucilaginibacter auburnensis]|uniref:Bifunctional NAD(P)H-hydrate repair enzyme n=1 Tax=Mucilaginibacter auburnensis TaxID=1457233 RepID=A0A2H9VSA2_9SPHI|nr:NAD(P)H-hydrate dehydratase [Mucilaginibacter auburnensis]PJJ83701.1 NAD(P)H-hydrate epimerase [Mucilaginibacter auburnensis]
MLPLLTAQQIREADAYTISNEPVSSIDLMERASKAFVGWFVNHYPDRKESIAVYCGSGNNGGDGLAISRMLFEHGYTQLDVKIASYSNRSTADFDTNLARLIQLAIPITALLPGEDLLQENAAIIIDALLGTGLNKALSGDYEKLAKFINGLSAGKVAVDIPTGFFADGEMPVDAPVIKADVVISFQQPKINFLLPDSAKYVDCWQTVNIGLSETFTNSLDSPYQFLEEKDARALIKPRHHFSNKGTYGHAFIIAGEAETMGAALLSSSACLYAGAGLTTACIPQAGLFALNSSHPEIMAVLRQDDEQLNIEWDKYTAVGIGPGLGKKAIALQLLSDVLERFCNPIVADADALNLLAENPILLKKLPAESILTPHMKEFDRLFGEHNNWWQRMQTARVKAAELGINIVLKNDYTLIITPHGKVYFNSTSNPAMATGGMGDVLTGIITSLIAQKYQPEEACLLGVYIHGKAGDELALPDRAYVVTPTQIANRLPATMAKLLA